MASIYRPAPSLDDARVTRGIATAIGVVGAVLCAIAVVFVVNAVPPEQAAGRGAVEALVVGVPMVAGLYAIRMPRHERFGLLLLAAGFVWSLPALAVSDESLPYSIGRVVGWLVFPSVIYITLAFPDGRIAPGVDRALFRALNLLLVALFIGSALVVEGYPAHTPWTTCVADCPPNAFLLLAHEPAIVSDLIEPMRELLAVALFACALV